ncbi:MAG: molybdopterin-dependent oxidoreductase, partial [Leptospirales bacterium]|nr:molybdopterin-dependent oxidoreductase [Leptospirales bacterium]
APVIHDYRPNNMSVEYHWNFGDVDKAFDESYFVHEDRFATGKVIVGFLEPPASLAYYDPSGYITVWAAKQSPYFHYRHLADCFNLPLSKIRIVQPFIGGGFGGTKNDTIAGDMIAVMGSKKTGKPVKFIYSQEEVLTTCRRRHNMIVYSKMGVTKDGIIKAVQHKVVANGGAYTAISPLSMYLAGFITPLPYKLPNFKYDAYRVFTNNPVSAAMRGHGATHTRFACEIQMDMIAEKLGLDPLDMRMRNAIDNPKRGEAYTTVNGVVVRTCGIKEALQIVADDDLWKNKKSIEKTDGTVSWGVGLSGTSYPGGARQLGHQSCAAIIRICEDGTVNYLTGATDCGQGSDTGLSMIVAEALGVRYEDIDIKRVDTAYTPVDAGSYGSRVAILAGQAGIHAAEDAKKQLLEAAAKAWNVGADDVELKDSVCFIKSKPEQKMSFNKLAKIACYEGSGAVIIGRGYSSYGVEKLDFDKGTGNGSVSYSFTSQAVKLGVDMETGKIDVSDFLIAHDCGRPLHPITCESQNEGGAVQALGQAIYEEFIMDNGDTKNSSFLDYKMPRTTDVPKIRVVDIITDDPGGPYGAKEVSEGSHVSTPPSVASAIHSATGIWFKELPVTPEKIVKALKKEGKWPGVKE